MRVVIPIVAGVGNALMAVPMVRQLKRHHPEAKITIVARIAAMADVFRRLSEVDESVVASSPIDSIRQTRGRHPDMYVVPFPSNRWQYSMLQFASGARRRLMHGYPIGHVRAMHFLPAERVPGVRGIHDVVQNLNLLRPLGIIPDETEAPVFPLQDADRAQADELLARVEGPFIAVHAGSARTILAKAKRWPPAKYAELIRRLNSQVVLLEGPDENGVATEILAHLIPSPGTPGEGGGEGGNEGEFKKQNALDVQTPVHEERKPKPHMLRLRGPLGAAAAVLKRASMYVGSDSGLAHLAAAVGTPPVTIFAPADPDRVSPFGYRHLVVQPNKSCSPCFLYPWKAPYPKMCCREPMCVDEISVDAVRQKIDLVEPGAPEVAQ